MRVRWGIGQVTVDVTGLGSAEVEAERHSSTILLGGAGLRYVFSRALRNGVPLVNKNELRLGYFAVNSVIGIK